MSAELLLSLAAIVIAAGALAVSIISLRLQKRTRAEQRATQVQIRVAEHSLPAFHGIVVFDGRPTPPPLLTYEVNVVAHNHGERPESIRELGIWDVQRRQGQVDEVGKPLPPGGAIERTLQFSDELLELARADGFIAVAELGSGIEVVSSIERLSDDLLAELAENERERRAWRR